MDRALRGSRSFSSWKMAAQSDQRALTWCSTTPRTVLCAVSHANGALRSSVSDMPCDNGGGRERKDVDDERRWTEVGAFNDCEEEGARSTGLGATKSRRGRGWNNEHEKRHNHNFRVERSSRSDMPLWL